MKNNILIISADNGCINSLAKQAERNDFSICVYDGLKKAIKHITFEEYQFYFIDLDLGADEAIFFINLLNDLKNKPVTIIVTSPIAKELEGLVRGTGVTLILSKPLQDTELEGLFQNKEYLDHIN